MNWEMNKHCLFVPGLLALAAFFIYLPSELGAAMTIPPDSSEYSICLANLLEHGRFGFTLNGEWYPSRYTPWFSLFFLFPAYLLSGGNLLCMHWAILGFALALLVALWRMGRLCGLGKLSILPPILLMFMPDFVFYSRIAMTEIPYAALVAITALVFVRLANQGQPSLRFCFYDGLLIAWAFLARSTGFALGVPFGLAILAKRGMEWKRKIALLFALGLPVAAAQMVSLGFNWMVFGSPFRSGYNYWNAIPNDFPDLMFNWKYVISNVEYLLSEPIIKITIAFLFLPLAFALLAIVTKNAARHRAFLMLTGYVFVHLLALSCLYIGYHWPDTRFFLPITICSIPLFFVAINKLLLKSGNCVRIMLMAIVFGLSLFAMCNSPTRYIYMVKGRPVWLVEAQISGSVLPPDSTVIQQGDPNVLDFFGFKEKRLTLFPFSRNFDYLNYMTAPTRITKLAKSPVSLHQLIIPELVDSGVCGMPFPSVFVERPELVCDYVAEGKNVFFLRSHFCVDENMLSFKSRIEGMGLALKPFGVWNVPGVSPNPIRHLYDRLMFQGYSMDSRPEITVAYYQIVKAYEAGK